MIKYLTKDNLRKNLFGLKGSQGNRQTAWGAGASHLQWQAGSKENKVEVGRGCEPSKSTPSSVLSPAKLYLLRAP